VARNHVLHLDGGEAVTAKCLLTATGADYNRLGVEGCEGFEGVGGGNSAGQAAVLLSGHAQRVVLLIRGGDLYKNMSN
jgi:thioredoxin reductase (NADPH)